MVQPQQGFSLFSCGCDSLSTVKATEHPIRARIIFFLLWLWYNLPTFTGHSKESLPFPVAVKFSPWLLVVIPSLYDISPFSCGCDTQSPHCCLSQSQYTKASFPSPVDVTISALLLVMICHSKLSLPSPVVVTLHLSHCYWSWNSSLLTA